MTSRTIATSGVQIATSTTSTDQLQTLRTVRTIVERIGAIIRAGPNPAARVQSTGPAMNTPDAGEVPVIVSTASSTAAAV